MTRRIPRLMAAAIACVVLCTASALQAASAADLVREAEQLYATLQYDAAGQAFERALRVATEDRDAAAAAEAQAGLGRVLYQRADYARARDLLSAALDAFQTLGSRLGTARVSRTLGSVALQTGDFPAARRYYERTLAIAEQDGLAEEQARVLSSLAYLPDAPRAERNAWIDKALEVSRRAGLRDVEANLLHQRGDQLFADGDFAAAQDNLDKAAAAFEQLDDRERLARVLTSLGRLYRAHGQTDRALDCYRRALTLQEAIGDRQGAIQSINATATALEAQGKLAEANTLYTRGLTLAEQTGSPRIISFMRGNLGGSYLHLGDYARARELLESVVAQPMDPYIASYRYGALASTYLALKEYGPAVKAADRAVAAVKESGSLERLPDAMSQRVAARTAAGQLREALADANDLLAAIETLRAKLSPSDLMKRGFGDVWANAFGAAVQLHHDLGEPGPAIEAGEMARARAFVDLLATRNVQGKPSDRDRFADLQRVDGELKAVGVDPSAPVSALTFRGGDARASSLVRRWKSADPELRSFIAAEPTSIADIVATAKRLDSTILTYWVGPKETYIGVVRPDGQVHTTAVPVDATRLATLARSTQPTSAPPRPPVETARREEAWAPRARGADVIALDSGGRDARRELYRLLIAPVAEHLPREAGALLTIVPHGPLFLVSFAALVDDRGAYLLERYTIHYAPSTAVLQYTRGKTAPSRPPRYVLVGDPADLPTLDDGSALPRLPGSRQETLAIAQSLRGRDVTVLAGAAAHEQQVRERISAATVLHFATHGVVRDDDPFGSFLAFGRSGAEPAADGRLTAREIYGLDLHAQLVILSACRTGAGRVTGDGIIGLTRAFLYAGTPRVVATLWDVADEPGLYLLPAMYASLDKGDDPARALRTAQLKLLAQLRAGRVQVDGPFGRVTLPEDPLLWAGFVLVGEP